MTAGPPTARWTHVALPVGDLDRSIAFYTDFTPLVVLQRFADTAGRSAWLCHEGPSEHPFILVLVMFNATAGDAQPTLAPFAHLGIEVPERADVDDLAARAQLAGCLISTPQQFPAPVGYVCTLSDPDGNVVEISHDQAVYATFTERFSGVDEGH